MLGKEILHHYLDFSVSCGNDVPVLSLPLEISEYL